MKPTDITDQLRRIAQEGGITVEYIAKETELVERYVAAVLEGYPITPIAHLVKIAGAIGCKIKVKRLKESRETPPSEG